MEAAALSVEIKQCSQNYPVARLLLKGFSFAVKENYHEDTEMRKSFSYMSPVAKNFHDGDQPLSSAFVRLLPSGLQLLNDK